MSKFKGIILYDIQLDGNLTGVYTNNHPQSQGRLLTETAQLLDRNMVPNYRQNGVLDYECFYFDHLEGAINARLRFTIQNAIITAQWMNATNEIIFQGEGFQMNERQIAIAYWIPS